MHADTRTHTHKRTQHTHNNNTRMTCDCTALRYPMICLLVSLSVCLSRSSLPFSAFLACSACSALYLSLFSLVRLFCLSASLFGRTKGENHRTVDLLASYPDQLHVASSPAAQVPVGIICPLRVGTTKHLIQRAAHIAPVPLPMFRADSRQTIEEALNDNVEAAMPDRRRRHGGEGKYT